MSRFSRTLMSRKTSRPSGTCSTPAETILCEAQDWISSPAKRMRPFVTGTSRETVFSVVLLPAPFEPSRATIAPSGTLSETSESAWMRP